MGIKTKNLDKIYEDGLNVFDYKEIKTYNELIEYSKNNSKFTIRFDSEKEIYNLPFYKYDNNLNLKEIYDEAKKINCTLLCSNGYMYDNDLLFNFVIEIDEDNNYILEFSSKKVPLREMYRYKTTIINGNIFEKKYEEIQVFDEYSKKNIDKIINFILENNLKYKYIEGTIYSIKVGLYNKDLIIWQTYK